MTAVVGDEKARRAAEHAARTSYGRLLASLTARSRDIAAAEDALSAAFTSALSIWPERGVPDNPDAWLFTAARNLLTNRARSAKVRDQAAPEIERRYFSGDQPPVDDIPDRRLQMAFICAHPAIDAAARAPLMLQVVLGLDAARIAQAFLTDPATMSQRLVRAKARIRDSGLRFELPDRGAMSARLAVVLDAIYAAFAHGWDRTERITAPESLTGEAIWLARLIVELLPEEPEPKGLLALMLYCAARTDARRDAEGRFVPLAEQDHTLWNRTMIIEAESLLTAAARAATFGRYQCEAAIQSVHVQRPLTGRLNREALIMLYDMLAVFGDSMGAAISRAVVTAESGEAERALSALEAIDPARVRHHQPYWVALSFVMETLGRQDEARDALKTAIALTSDEAVRIYLETRLSDISVSRTSRGPGGGP